jgi:hypothetical protein
MTRMTKEWGAEGDDLGLVSDPGWKPDDLRLHLDWMEDDCIKDLNGMSLIEALKSEPFSRTYHCGYMLITIARIRRSRKAGNIDDAICGAIELGTLLAEEAAYTDIRWKLGERRYKVRGNAAKATWGTARGEERARDGLVL